MAKRFKTEEDRIWFEGLVEGRFKSLPEDWEIESRIERVISDLHKDPDQFSGTKIHPKKNPRNFEKFVRQVIEHLLGRSS